MPLTRRQFCLGSLALPAFANTKKPERPNVVLILVDDLPSWMLGCYGSKDVRTPNIDRLAQTGVRFANHFAAAPSPKLARASLLTGKTALQLGANDAVAPAGTLLAKTLGGAGYANGFIETGTSEETTAAAGQFLDRQEPGKNFLLGVWYRDLQPPSDSLAARHRELYAAAAFETCFPSTPPDPSVVRGKELLANLLASLRKTAAATTALDEQVGAVIAKLTQRKLLDRTLVVFTSTCGSLCGRHGIWGGGDSTEPPNMFEETVGTPMIWRWPSRLPPQTTRPESVSACDFVPSICDLAGITLDKLGLCGRSYAALATGLGLPKGQTWGNLAFSHLKDTDMARDSRYKLVLRNGGKGPNEFYDLQTDPSELTNAYDDAGYASVRPALAEAIAKWKQACSA